MADYREIRKLADELFERYGGMMTLSDVAIELGKAGRSTAKKFLEDHDVPGIKVGVYPRWESKLVARAIVNARGMY